MRIPRKRLTSIALALLVGGVLPAVDSAGDVKGKGTLSAELRSRARRGPR